MRASQNCMSSRLSDLKPSLDILAHVTSEARPNQRRWHALDDGWTLSVDLHAA